MKTIPVIRKNGEDYQVEDSQARQDVSNLKSALKTYSIDFVSGNITTNGTEGTNSNFIKSDYIPIDENTKFFMRDVYVGESANAYSFYNASKAYISGQNAISGNVFVDTIPENAKYLRFCTMILSGSTRRSTDFAAFVSYTNKADKVVNPTDGNFAGLDSNGNLTDSGKKATDFVKSSDYYATEIPLSSQDSTKVTPEILALKNETDILINNTLGTTKNIAELEKSYKSSVVTEYTKFKQNDIEGTKSALAGFVCAFIAEIENGKTYVLSFERDNNNPVVAYLYSDNIGGTQITYGDTGLSFQSTYSGTVYIGFFSGSSFTSFTVKNIQLEEGNTPTNFINHFTGKDDIARDNIKRTNEKLEETIESIEEIDKNTELLTKYTLGTTKNLAVLDTSYNSSIVTEYTELTPEYIEGTKEESSGFVAVFNAEIENGKTYKLSFVRDYTCPVTAYIYSDRPWGTLITNGDPGLSFTASYSGNAVICFFSGAAFSTFKIWDVMLEEGTIQTSYMPHFTANDLMAREQMAEVPKKVPFPVNESSIPQYGTSGQLLKTLGNGQTEWTDPIEPTPEQVSSAVESWIEGNPDKVASLIGGWYVTPEMFGAVGDGITDDTNALIACFASQKPVYSDNKEYKTTRPIPLYGSRRTINFYGTINYTGNESAFVFDSSESNIRLADSFIFINRVKAYNGECFLMKPKNGNSNYVAGVVFRFGYLEAATDKYPFHVQCSNSGWFNENTFEYGNWTRGVGGFFAEALDNSANDLSVIRFHYCHFEQITNGIKIALNNTPVSLVIDFCRMGELTGKYLEITGTPRYALRGATVLMAHDIQEGKITTVEGVTVKVIT